MVFNLPITVGVVIHLCAKGSRRLATEVDDAGVCAPTLPVENLALQRVAQLNAIILLDSLILTVNVGTTLPLRGVYLGHANQEIVIAGKLIVTRNGEVGIRGFVVFGLGFQIGDALVVVHLPETFHTQFS